MPLVAFWDSPTAQMSLAETMAIPLSCPAAGLETTLQPMRYLLCLGTLGFGGPVTLVKYIRSATQWTNEPGLRDQP